MSGSNMVQEEEVRRVAYAIWEQEGRPAGRDTEHYFKALHQLQEAHVGDPQDDPVNPAAMAIAGAASKSENSLTEKSRKPVRRSSTGKKTTGARGSKKAKSEDR